MNKLNVHVVFGLLSVLKYSTSIDINELSHVQNPVQLSVGECISFVSHPTYRAVGNFTWRKDTIVLSSASDRVVIAGNVLRILDVKSEDSGYYSAEVQTTEKRELFKFWVTVKECDENEKKNPFFQGRCQSWCETHVKFDGLNQSRTKVAAYTRKNATDLLQPVDATEKCEKGWKHFDGKCFKYFGEIKSWLAALDSCRSRDATLAVVENERENEFIGSLIESGEGAWIGLNDRYTESVYIWNNDKDNTASYFSWAKNEPSNTNGKCNIENCVEMKNPGLKWNDMICNGYNSYVCQLNKDNDNVSTSWQCYGNNCFKYFREQLIWKDAKMQCEKLGGELARITSSSVNHFVGGLIQSNIWIDLNDITEPGAYVWSSTTSGKPYEKASYFKWASGEPNDKLYKTKERCSGEDCMQINRWNNVVRWYDLECSKRLPYVCQKSRDSLLTIAAIIAISVGGTAILVVFVALIHFKLKNRKHKVQTKKFVFEIRK